MPLLLWAFSIVPLAEILGNDGFNKLLCDATTFAPGILGPRLVKNIHLLLQQINGHFVLLRLIIRSYHFEEIVVDSVLQLYKNGLLTKKSSLFLWYLLRRSSFLQIGSPRYNSLINQTVQGLKGEKKERINFMPHVFLELMKMTPGPLLGTLFNLSDEALSCPHYRLSIKNLLCFSIPFNLALDEYIRLNGKENVFIRSQWLRRLLWKFQEDSSAVIKQTNENY